MAAVAPVQDTVAAAAEVVVATAIRGRITDKDKTAACVGGVTIKTGKIARPLAAKRLRWARPR
jgi:hypothetical protein